MKTIKGFTITPPTLGSIRIGIAVTKGDRKMPQKDDAFTITTLVQSKDGWITHSLHNEVMKQQAPAREGAQQKIREIPVRLMFNDPDLNMRAEYSVFEPKSGRPLCAGDGQSARRRTAMGVEAIDCPGPDTCKYGQDKHCKLYARMNVQIEGQSDELGTFVFRTTGFNSVRTLSARMSYLHALTGGKLAGIPLSLRLRAKTSANSYKSVVYFVDLQVREGMSLAEACQAGQAHRQAWEDIGLSREAFEAAARDGFDRSAFEDAEEEGGEVLEAFYQGAEKPVPLGEFVDEDGVVRPEVPASANMRHSHSENKAPSRPVGGLAGLRATMNSFEGDGFIPPPSNQHNWHVPIS